ncbi:MAG: hypothetical protein JW395_2422 [Nitrospira sp.]|nr:hypothetical protein [Nitrospira sp.]
MPFNEKSVQFVRDFGGCMGQGFACGRDHAVFDVTERDCADAQRGDRQHTEKDR